jgi:serine/threonine protein phosphatase PrpC
MDTNSKHQNDAITTDQKFRNEDEHLREIDKRHLKQSEEKDPELIAKKEKTPAPSEEDGD